MPLWTALHTARQQGVPVNIGQAMLARPEGPTDVLPETLVFNNVAGQTLSVDVYLPASQASGRRPAAIIVHGGGWYARDKSDLPRSNRWFVEQGFSVFDIQYRLAPQPNWQTALGDVKCAIGWVKRNADRFRIDPNRITLVGRSAGAHLALLAAYTPSDPLFPPSCEGADTNVEQVVAFYGPVDLLYSYAHPGNPAVFDSQASLRRLLGGSPTQVHGLYELNSPIRYVTSKTPRTLLFHGGLDEYVRPMNMTFLEEKLRAAGVGHRAVFLPCSHHGFDYLVGGFGWQLATGVMKQFFARP